MPEVLAYLTSVSTMKWKTLLMLPILLYLVKGQQQKIFHFLDYKNVSVENTGWLVLKQDESNPLTLPPQYSLCLRLFKWYERLKYTSFGTINLIDEFGNITNQYVHAVSWGGHYMMADFFKRNYKYQVGQDLATHEWSHVCYSLDFKNEVWKVVVDGKLVGDGNFPIYDPIREKYVIKENQRFELILGT